MINDSVDSLTGLLNRSAFDSKLADALRNYSDDNGTIALILADIDHFKAVNDKRGYWAGDEALKSVATLLQTLTGDHEIVCRYGGDEFVLLSVGTSASQAHILAQHIETEVACLKLTWEGHDLGQLSMTTGVALCPRDSRQAPDLFQAADLAMHRRKRDR